MTTTAISTASQLYTLTLREATEMVGFMGHDVTCLVRGPMGTGKSSILKTLAKQYPDYVPCYFDGTTKDLGDMMYPKIARFDETGKDYATFVPNEEFGLHLGKPVILMIDEIGKMFAPVRNACMRLMYERVMASTPVPGIIFATTNNSSENLGDVILPHQNDRMTELVISGPTNEEWVEDFAIPNGLEAVLIKWAIDNPQLFHNPEMYKDYKDNEYIPHPTSPHKHFCTPRSMHRANHWLTIRDKISSKQLMAALIGTLGPKGAADLHTHIAISDQMPTQASIKADPRNAVIPRSAAACQMVVYRALTNMKLDMIDPWMDYMLRLEPEHQSVFANQARRNTYPHRQMVMTNPKFVKWSVANNFAFTADKN